MGRGRRGMVGRRGAADSRSLVCASASPLRPHRHARPPPHRAYPHPLTLITPPPRLPHPSSPPSSCSLTLLPCPDHPPFPESNDSLPRPASPVQQLFVPSPPVCARIFTASNHRHQCWPRGRLLGRRHYHPRQPDHRRRLCCPRNPLCWLSFSHAAARTQVNRWGKSLAGRGGGRGGPRWAEEGLPRRGVERGGNSGDVDLFPLAAALGYPPPTPPFPLHARFPHHWRDRTCTLRTWKRRGWREWSRARG